MNKTFKDNNTIGANTRLYFNFEGNGTEWIDYKLPCPNFLKHISNNRYIIGWYILGFQNKHTSEVQKRIKQTFNCSILEHKPTKNNQTHIFNRIHTLRDFNGLESITRAKRLTAKNININLKDEAFFAIKFFTEYLIREEGTPAFKDLEDFAFDNYPKKCKSTLRAKCRSVFHWYSDRDFIIPTKNKYKNLKDYQEKTKMTRIENMKKLHLQKENLNRKKVNNIISGLFADDYKKKNGKWNSLAISKALSLDPRTVRKYIQN